MPGKAISENGISKITDIVRSLLSNASFTLKEGKTLDDVLELPRFSEMMERPPESFGSGVLSQSRDLAFKHIQFSLRSTGIPFEHREIAEYCMGKRKDSPPKSNKSDYGKLITDFEQLLRIILNYPNKYMVIGTFDDELFNDPSYKDLKSKLDMSPKKEYWEKVLSAEGRVKIRDNVRKKFFDYFDIKIDENTYNTAQRGIAGILKEEGWEKTNTTKYRGKMAALAIAALILAWEGRDCANYTGVIKDCDPCPKCEPAPKTKYDLLELCDLCPPGTVDNHHYDANGKPHCSCYDFPEVKLGETVEPTHTKKRPNKTVLHPTPVYHPNPVPNTEDNVPPVFEVPGGAPIREALPGEPKKE